MGIERLFTQSATVETRTGVKNGVIQYAAPATRSVFLNDSHKLVRNAAGDEVVSSTILYDTLDAGPLYVVGSKVTANGRTAFVLGAYRRDSAGPAWSHHTQVDLT